MNNADWIDYAASLREPMPTFRMSLWRFAAGLRFLPVSIRARLTDFIATAARRPDGRFVIPADLEPFADLVVCSICGVALGYLVWQMARAGWIFR